MNSLKYVFVCVLTVAFATPLIAEECRKAEGGRVETLAELAEYEDVCEITRSVGIFLTEPAVVDLPKLKRARFLNIDGENIEAVFLPALERADFFVIKGSQIQMLEVPRLKEVGEAFYILHTGVQQLDLVSLEYVNHLMIKGNQVIDEIFAPFVRRILEAEISLNPNLPDDNQSDLLALVDPDGAGIRAARHAADEAARERALAAVARYHARTMAPTGVAGTHADGSDRSYDGRRHRYPRYQPYYPIIRPCITGGCWFYRYWL